MNEATPALRICDGAARVGGRTVWSDVDVTVGPGEFVAVLGPNGAGKSTLVKVALGLVPLASGSVKVLGKPPAAARSSIGYLPQRRSFQSDVRIRGVDLVRLGLDGTRWGVPLPTFGRVTAKGRETHARVEEVVDLVGATAYARRPIGELSGGEQQRLLIAQALIRRPRLLLLDEPLDSLDLPNQVSVAGLVSLISRTEGVAVVIVAHDVNPIVTYLDRVVYLASGRAASGTVDEVITSDRLSRLYGTPIEVLRTATGRVIVVGGPDAPALHSDRHAHAHEG